MNQIVRNCGILGFSIMLLFGCMGEGGKSNPDVAVEENDDSNNVDISGVDGSEEVKNATPTGGKTSSLLLFGYVSGADFGDEDYLNGSVISLYEPVQDGFPAEDAKPVATGWDISREEFSTMALYGYEDMFSYKYKKPFTVVWDAFLYIADLDDNINLYSFSIRFDDFNPNGRKDKFAVKIDDTIVQNDSNTYSTTLDMVMKPGWHSVKIAITRTEPAVLGSNVTLNVSSSVLSRPCKVTPFLLYHKRPLGK